MPTLTLSAFRQIQKLLPKLTPTERVQLKLLLGEFKGGSTQGKATHAETNDWLLTGIMSELARRGYKYSPQVTRKMSPEYEESSQIVRKELVVGLRQTIPHPKYVELLALGRVSAKALADYIAAGKVHREVTVGLRNMLIHVGRTLEAIDVSYPGYLSCGQIGFLVKSKR